ncbi:hypothetical protein M3C61_07975 [Dermacoccus abyssi]|nr:hypothetical protein [Dermacoccus abyssi]MCT1986951.1 hypothetical protein [Dermacoccus abyssi]
MYKVLLAAAAAAAAICANSEYQKQQLGKELWAKATDQPENTAPGKN